MTYISLKFAVTRTTRIAGASCRQLVSSPTDYNNVIYTIKEPSSQHSSYSLVVIPLFQLGLFLPRPAVHGMSRVRSQPFFLSFWAFESASDHMKRFWAMLLVFLSFSHIL